MERMNDYLLVRDVSLVSDICNEDKLLEYFKLRYQNDVIYSNIGDILISINPYMIISGDDYLRDVTIPHVYNLSKRIYNEMMSTSCDQCCIISGESGAGKTEVCKYLVKHVTQFSGSRNNLELRILQMNPLLEGFGNAQTTMNNNSSRFGKYLQLKFNGIGKVTGAKINEYLLEKSRVVYQNPGERNFHVFYWMLEGLDTILKINLNIHDRCTFRYLGGKTTTTGDEKQKFKELRDCLDLVGFKEEEQEDIFLLIGSILHIGNINIDENDSDQSVITQSHSIDIASRLLGLQSDTFIQLLTISVSTARGEVIRKHNNKIKSEAIRDSISKTLYDRLFRWIVNQINQLLAPKLEDVAWGCDIGILDIFGFEDFQRNSFEQLCINLANEQLHNFFIQHIFHIELSQYNEEGVNGADIVIQDTQPLLDCFFLGSKSIFHFLDDQGSVPRATDATFLHKLNERMKKESFYTPSKSISSGTFAITHFAGKVLYSVNGFLEKNMDTLPSGVKKCFENSSNELVSLLFRASINRTGTLALHKTTGTSKISGKRRVSNARRGRSMNTPTISSQFKSSLSVLVTKMSSAVPHFIRCLKPNKLKKPHLFDDEFVKRQLWYTGMLSTMQIRKEGFAYRPTFQEFHERFGSLCYCDASDISLVDVCQLILCESGITNAEYQIGYSKLFLRHYHLDKLERKMKEHHSAASRLQSVAISFIHRKRYKKLLQAIKRDKAAIKKLMTDAKNNCNKVERRLERLTNQDEKRHLDDQRESLIIQQLSFLLPKLPPPADIRELPPPLLLDSDDEEEEERIESLRKKSSRLKMDDTMFVKVELKRPHQQSRMLRSSVSSSHSWLHGMISQKKAEEMLKPHQHGTFLVRINRKKFSHILSYKSKIKDNINHLSISQLPNSKYVLSGETNPHNSIDNLVEYHYQVPIQSSNDLLVLPCPEESDGTENELRIEISGSAHAIV